MFLKRQLGAAFLKTMFLFVYISIIKPILWNDRLMTDLWDIGRIYTQYENDLL